MISICIPAYKNVGYLQRLLESIAIQTFTDFEAVISDDSPDDSVRALIARFEKIFNIKYFKNAKPYGMPGNWNHVIAQANGEWIKLMHDDDWFSSPHSLQTFADETNKGCKFIFSAYTNVYEGTGKTVSVKMTNQWHNHLIKEPLTLMATNVIGPPSVTMVHRSIAEKYDERMKWRVDIDFYIRVLDAEKNFIYINKPLIDVGISSLQVTNECFENPAVELPEGLMLLEKFGLQPLRNIWVYDAWWRLLRNMHIENEEQLYRHSPGKWPAIITAMLKHVNKVPRKVISLGAASKTCMLFSFLVNRPVKNQK